MTKAVGDEHSGIDNSQGARFVPASASTAALSQALSLACEHLTRPDSASPQNFLKTLGHAGLYGLITHLEAGCSAVGLRLVNLPAGTLEDFSDLRFSLVACPCHAQVVQSGQGQYCSLAGDAYASIFPSLAQALSPLAPALHLIIAPLKLDGQVVGTLDLIGPDLAVSDIPLVQLTANLLALNLDWTLLAGSARHDQRERQLSEAALRQSNDAFRIILEQSADGILLVDEDGKIIDWNRSMEMITGKSRQQALGKCLWELQYDLFPGPKSDKLLSHLKNSLQAYLKHGLAPYASNLREHPIRHDDGSVRSVQLISYPIPTQRGFRIGAVCRDITESKQMEEDLRRRAEELQLLHAVALDITAALDLPILLKAVVERAVKLLKGSGGLLYLCSPEKDEVQCVVSYRASRNYTGVVLRYGEGAAGQVAQTGQPLLIEDYRAWTGSLDLSSNRKNQKTAVITLPMTWQGSVIGILQIIDSHPGRTFSQEDQNLLALFADHAAIALENSRLLSAERAARDQAETLREVAQVVSSSLNLDEVLHHILAQLKRVLPFDTTSVILFAENGSPALVAGIGYEDTAFTSQVAGSLLEQSPILTRMAQDLQPVVIADVHDNPDWIWVPGATHVNAFLAVPIVARTKMIGALMVDSAQKNFFNENHLQNAHSLAQHMAVAIQNARLFEAERSQLLLAQTLKEVGALLTSELSLAEVLESILDLLGRVVAYDSNSIQLIDETGKLQLAAGRGFPDIDRARQIVYELSDHMLEHNWAEQGVLTIGDTEQSPFWEPARGSEYIRSWMGAPLLVKGRLIGTLNCDSRQPNTYDEQAQQTVIAFANQAAVAIENARLFEEQEKRAAELEALRQASLSLTSSLDFHAVLDAILQSTLRLAPAAGNAHIFLYSAEENTLTFGAALWASGQQGVPFTQPRPDGLTATVAGLGQSIVVPDMSAHQLFKDQAGQAGWTGSIVGLPLKIGGRVVGVMNVSYSLPRQFPEPELYMLRLLADQAAIAIENAHLFQQAQLERSHLSALYQIGRDLATSLDRDTILERALRLACETIGGVMGEALLYLPETQQLNVRAVFNPDDSRQHKIRNRTLFEPGYGLTGWVAQTLSGVNISDLANDPHWVPIPGMDADMRSAVTAPVLDDNRLLAVISILHPQVGAFSRSHLDLLQAICQQVGLALTNAERYQQVQNLVDLLAAEQSRLESLIARLPVGVLLLDEDHRLLVSNPEGRLILETLKLPGQGEVLTDLGGFLVDDLMARHTDPLPIEIDWEGPPRCILEVQACPIAGEVRQWVLVIRNVTHERENQNRIQMQERLATVGQLAAGIAHDFNNIMAAIMVYTDLLSSDLRGQPTSSERVVIIQQQLKRASSLIRQILDFSRRSLMEQSPIDLLPFLKELDKLLRRLLPENIRVELACQPGVYLANADPTRLQQVFMNLALNARDAMPDGGELCFSLAHFQAGPHDSVPFPDLLSGQWLRLAVQDTGDGIPADVLPHIFEPFFTTKQVGQGTGLGLAQVYGIIKQHNGFIEATSQKGKGTTFTVYLPALQGQEQIAPQAELRDEFDGGGAPVLLVEDDQVTREALRTLLASQNYQVFAAANGKDALDLFDAVGGVVTLVISDVVMPEMGGMVLYQEVRKRQPDARMLFITGHPLELGNQMLLENSFVRWLQKPFSVQEFSQTVQALLSGGASD